jgi:hypothetical protein
MRGDRIGRARADASDCATTAGNSLISFRRAMSENPGSSNERPCLHCLIGDLIDEFYAEYGTTGGETDVIDMDEAISALAKTVADLTYGSDAAARKSVLDTLVREIAEFEAEYERTPESGLLIYCPVSEFRDTSQQSLTRTS